MDLEHIVTLFAGAALVFIFAALYRAVCFRRTGRDLTDFQQFLFGTGAVYYCIVFWELLKFFLDYYIPGSVKQGFQKTAADFTLFHKLFGTGLAGEPQLPLLNTDLNFVCGMVGGAIGGAAFLLIMHFHNKKKNRPERGLFYGYTFPRKSFKAYIRDEFAEFRAQVPLWEYATWWIVRGLLVYGIVTIWPKDGFTYNVLQMFTNLGVSLVIPLIRFLFFGKLYLGKISYHVQSIINIFVVAGTFFGHVVGFSWNIPSYDKFLHFLSGGIAVFIGYILICGARNREAVSRGAYVVASSGFSCVVMILWEVFEFVADYSLPDCNNQDYTFNPPEDFFFFRLFGRGAMNPGQYAVLDTDIDIILAVLGVIVCAAILWAALYIKDKKTAKQPETEKVGAEIMND